MVRPLSETKIAVLGCTGSVGTQAVEALSSLGCRIVLLTAGRNLSCLQTQMARVHPAAVAVADDALLPALRETAAKDGCLLYGGVAGICEAIGNCGADVIIHAVAGLAGIPYAISAAKTGARLAMANKEVIISAGELLFDLLRTSGGELIPVDSEHSAIFQCLTTLGPIDLCRHDPSDRVRRILLTASGGPFVDFSVQQMTNVTAAQALAHPTWKMGGKITVDCATMMNKGFEVLEAARLFSVSGQQIEVLVHRQSVVHSLVEFRDRAIMAQLGLPDMRTCIRYAVSYPDRAEVPVAALDLTVAAALTFEKPDIERFPLLALAFEVLLAGGTAPTALIAADEEAVGAFLTGRLSFTGIADAVRGVMDRVQARPVTCFDDVLTAEADARREAQDEIRRISL